MTDFNELVGKTIVSITGMQVGSEDVRVVCSDGTKYMMVPVERSYGCVTCRVTIEDVAGDVQDLIGNPILLAEEVSSDSTPPEPDPRDYMYCSNSWTFYKFATINGSVTLRWLGESNGHYSESVDFKLVSKPDPKPTPMELFQSLVSSREPELSLPGSVQVECPACMGSGLHNGCTACAGRGWVLASGKVFEGSSGCCDTSTSDVVGNGTED